MSQVSALYRDHLVRLVMYIAFGQTNNRKASLSPGLVAKEGLLVSLLGSCVLLFPRLALGQLVQPDLFGQQRELRVAE